MNTREMQHMMHAGQRQQQLELEDLEMHDETAIQFKMAKEFNEEVKVLEKKVGDLQYMTQDIAMLVYHQGPMVDNIESNMNLAVQHTEDGTDRLEKIAYAQRTCVIL